MFLAKLGRVLWRGYLLRILLMLALLVSSGAHRGFLQSLAWSNMLITYSNQEGSWETSFVKTFDGSSPCSMCLGIAEANEEDQKNGKKPQALLKHTIELHWVIADTVITIFSPRSSKSPILSFESVIQEGHSLTETPPPEMV